VLVGVSADGQFIGVSPAVAVSIGSDNAGAGTRVAGQGKAAKSEDHAQRDGRDTEAMQACSPPATECG
jgi:hypothetical protein